MKPVVERILEARLWVGALGERLRWWPGQFTYPVGYENLKRIFPRSWQRAIIESVTWAARLHHDALTPGRSGFHLFRLKQEQEDDLTRHLLSEPLPLPGEDLARIEAALETLGAVLPDQVEAGPRLMGPASLLRRHDTLSEVAGVYLKAARSGIISVPYFSVEAAP